MITVQPIRYTSHQSEWHRLVQVLGFRPAFPPNPQWSEFDGRGILAIHHAAADDDHAGRTDLHLLSDDLDGVEARLTGAGFDVNRTLLDDIGPMLTVAAVSGARITISGGARTADSGELAVQPIWYQSDLDEPRRVLETIGLRPRIASDAGTWIDFAADGGGQAALHHADAVRVELSLEYAGDLDALAKRLADAGLAASVIDEAYNRTLLVDTPDGDELWINGQLDDLYGYTRLDA
ncbi:MAG: hypothetical protein KIT69_09970 [Propionibacteriaceae bacterium]|nr:hypothetical protein [Propionibacteriaceae bacterium]